MGAGPWTTALSELRELTNDNDNSKIRWRKRCVGVCNGTNTAFKTFEFRRYTDFTTSAPPLGVYITDSSTPATIVTDDPISGQFTLSTAPSMSDFVEATYYIQYFLDQELTDFLGHAANWLFNTNDYTISPPGLQPAVLKYAAGDAYEMLSDKFQDHLSATFRMEDAPDEKNNTSMVDYFQKRCEYFKKGATEARDEYYTRQGQSLQPLSISAAGAVRDVPPRA